MVGVVEHHAQCSVVPLSLHDPFGHCAGGQFEPHIEARGLIPLTPMHLPTKRMHKLLSVMVGIVTVRLRRIDLYDEPLLPCRSRSAIGDGNYDPQDAQKDLSAQPLAWDWLAKRAVIQATSGSSSEPGCTMLP
jgi:hypothetical protein